MITKDFSRADTSKYLEELRLVEPVQRSSAKQEREAKIDEWRRAGSRF